MSSLFCCFNCIFDGNSCYANKVDPDQMSHVASDLVLHCLHMTFYGFPGNNGIRDPSKEGRQV